MFLTNCISSRGREMGGGGWVIYLFIYLWGVVLSNTEMVRKREQINVFYVWLLVGRRRKRGRERDR